ncbi:MAG: thiol protease/hemagglutinin PrtT [Prolixibacteraceae bacterium]
MKKLLLTLLFFLLISNFLWARHVERERALKVAENFLKQQNGVMKSAPTGQLSLIPIKLPGEFRFSHTKSSQPGDKQQLLYLFKSDTKGFVLVAGDDRARPILAYSSSEMIEEEHLPVNMLKWLEEYKRQIRYIINHPEMKSANSTSEWISLEQGMALEKASNTAVSPLMTTTWSQSPYYNELCPQEYWNSEKAVTGCVATAMAQVMKYHNYPKQGFGIHSYYHSNNTVTYGNLSANFGATNYDWSNMPNNLSSGSSAIQVNAIAKLMLHCGISVNMDYSPESSGAWVTEEKSPEETCSEFAFKEFFGYDKSSVMGVQREGKTTQQWINLIKFEIDAKRPVLFAGVGDGGGHAFVGDGYDSNNFFHMNWGWGGVADGFYSVDAFNPGDIGTGGGSGGFNSYQRIVVGVQPPAEVTTYDIRLYGDMAVPDILQFSPVRIDMKLANYGDNLFAGDIGLAIFDENGDFVEFMETFSAQLESNNYYNIWFDSEGLSVYPGNYYFGVYYQVPGANWSAVADGEYTNFVSGEVLSPFEDSKIKLYDSIAFSPSPLILGEAYRIDTKLANFGTTDYAGQYGAGLFTLNGDLAQELEVIPDITLTANHFHEVWFDAGTVDVDPGTYLLGLVHFPDDEEGQWVVAPGEYRNPIRVNVTVPPLGPDDFENNDDTNVAFQFNLNFEDNHAGFNTLGSNIHSNTDQDYYLIDLPQGYNYTILARAHDNYNSEMEEAFTGDVIWAHAENSDWSQLYDDEMDAPFTVLNGGQVYFGVLPYYEGQTGSYAFSVEIQREITTGLEQMQEAEGINVFPNPVKDALQIRYAQVISNYELFDSSGKQVGFGDVNEKNFTINVNKYDAGLYVLKLYCNQKIVTKKIMINE